MTDLRDPRLEAIPVRAGSGRPRAGSAAAPAEPARNTALPPAAMPGSGDRVSDRDERFRAVKDRLGRTVGEWLAATREPQLQQTASRSHADLLECMATLDDLHASSTRELDRRQQLERQMVEVDAQLSQARAEVAAATADRPVRPDGLHDDLTSLPNRGHFCERLKSALARVQPDRHVLWVLYLDLDGFETINETHGHEAGDELLRIVAARLARVLRSEDMVSRVGGDKFACLLTDLPNRVLLSHLACKWFDAVAAPLKIGHLDFNVRPSIGITKCPGDGSTAEELLRNADAAMCSAKRQQIGYAFFDERTDVWARE